MSQITNKVSITFMLLCFFLTSYSQDFDVNISKGVKILRGYNQFQTVKSGRGEYLVLGTAPPQVFGRASTIHEYLSFISKNSEEAHVEVKVPYENTRTYQFLKNSKKMIRVIVEKNKKEKRLKKYFQEFDDDGKPIGVKEYASAPYTKHTDQPDIATMYSEDNKLALLYDDYDKNIKQLDFKGVFTIINDKLEVIHKYEYNPGISQKMCNIEHVTLQNDGSFSFLIKKYKTKKAREVIKQGKIKVPGYEYILIIKKKELPPEEIRIDLDNKFTRGGSFTTNNSGDYLLFFPYDSDHKKKMAVGFYTILIDNESKEVTKNMHPFNNEEMKQFATWKKRNLGLDEDFIISPLVAKDENQIAFTLERLVFQPIQTSNAWMHMSSVSFIVDNQANFKDYLHVPKNYYEFQAHNLVQPHFIDGKLIVFYNDFNENIDRKLSDYKDMEGYAWGKSKVNLYYAYKEDGEVKRHQISKEIIGGNFNSDCLLVEGDKVIIPFVEVGGDDDELKIITLSKKDKSQSKI